VIRTGITVARILFITVIILNASAANVTAGAMITAMALSEMILLIKYYKFFY
jgi:hypothetical protein